MEKKDIVPEEVFKEKLPEAQVKDMLSVCRSSVREQVLEAVAMAILDIEKMTKINQVHAYRIRIMRTLEYLLFNEVPPVWNSTYYRCQGAVDTVIAKKVLDLKMGLDKSQIN